MDRVTALQSLFGQKIGGQRRRLTSMVSTLDTPPAYPEVMSWTPEGESYWTWQDYKVHYVVRRPAEKRSQKEKPLVLVHGFGANYYHWRYNVIPLVNQGYSVYCIDLLGFGLSAKPVIPYSADTWSDQLGAFLREVVGQPAVLAGNSLGGFVALATAVDYPDETAGVILLNAAGRYRDPDAIDPEENDVSTTAKDDTMTNPFDAASQAIRSLFTKLFFRASFALIKRPQRIESVIRSVYPVDPSNVDKTLVESIAFPARNPKAADVYPLVITRPGGKGRYMDDLIDSLRPDLPILLAWGVFDPWIRPTAADRFIQVYAQNKGTTNFLRRSDLKAGHCPMDECPEITNSAIISWLSEEDSDLRW